LEGEERRVAIPLGRGDERNVTLFLKKGKKVSVLPPFACWEEKNENGVTSGCKRKRDRSFPFSLYLGKNEESSS